MMTVYFPPDFGGQSWGAVNPALTIDLIYHRSNVIGGPIVAEIAVTGPQNALWELLTWLRRPVEILDDHSQSVWWGMVNEARVQVGGLTIGVTLDNMVNRVAVAYATTNPNGSPVSGRTTWVSDDDSIDRYGTKEELSSLGEGDVAAAEAKRAELLASHATPRGVPSAGEGNAVSATVICVGWFETLKWLKFERLEGRSEFDSSGSEAHSIGWGLTSSLIGFAATGLHHLYAGLTAFDVGDQVIVSGSASNDGTLTVTQAAAGERVVYVATTISFDPGDDINDSALGFGFVESDSFISVAGSSANSGYHLIDETGDDHIATVAELTGAITTEAAGPSITIAQGHRLTISEALTDEIPGASITLAMVGVQLAQSFLAESSYTVARIAIPVGRIGSPTDDLIIELRSDSSGPGSVLESVSVTGTDLTEDSRPWRWIDCANTTAITSGTTYWIAVRRSGTASAQDYYSLGLTEEVSGSCQVWNGSAWVAHPRALYLPHRVWGAEENATQMARIISDGGQFIVGSDIVSTGVATHQWRDADMTAYDELVKLMAQGNSAGQRLLATVTADRYLRIYAEPTRSSDGDRLMSDGGLRNIAGGRRQRGLLPTGEWLVVDDLPGYINDQLDISPLFVDESAWNAQSPATFEITPKAAEEI